MEAARGSGQSGRVQMTISGFVEHLVETESVHWADFIPWRVSEGVLIPAVMPHCLPKTIDERAVTDALRRSRAPVAIWTTDWDTDACEWWATACDEPKYSLDCVQGKGRRKNVRRGLSRCVVRRVRTAELLEQGYVVYREALNRYEEGPAILSQEEFRQELLTASRFEGHEIWGAFADGRLAAYGRCLVYDGAVHRTDTKSDPRFHHANPNEALGYVITHHYLVERQAKYVMSGWPALSSRTRVREFAESMGYRRIYAPLRVQMNPWVKLFMNMGADALCRGTVGVRRVDGAFRKVNSLRKLLDIEKNCRSRRGPV